MDVRGGIYAGSPRQQAGLKKDERIESLVIPFPQGKDLWFLSGLNIRGTLNDWPTLKSSLAETFGRLQAEVDFGT